MAGTRKAERNAAMSERIVVAVNGGQGSDAALAWMLERAESADFSVELVAVIENQPMAFDFPEELLEPAYAAVLDAAATEIHAKAPRLEILQSIRRGPVVRELLAASIGASLLVIGTRDPTGYFSGTLRHHVAAGAHCPVVAVPAGWSPIDGPVVVGVDDDASSDPAIEFAAAEALRLDEELQLVHAWHLPVALVAMWVSTGSDPYVEIHRPQETLLKAVATATRVAHPSLEVRELLEHGPTSAILADIAGAARLAVVGRHRRGVIPGLLLGSVGHDLLVTMPCPVAIVSPAKASDTAVDDGGISV